ncbi:MAG: hypothetical protein ACD_18C00097G0002 [uncultured bacterium]|nr:MAG: hypothetical protein ACD_18C00097G0002 [uncultured bacterium]
MPKEVENIVSKEVILQPKVEKFLKQISKLKTSLTNATNDEVRTSLESDIYEVVVSSDPDVLEKAVEKDPYIMIVYLQRELKIVSSAYNITLKQKISQDTPNIELEERPKSIAIPERKENESDKSFEKRLASYFQLLNDQMKLYFIRAKSELSTEIEKNNIIIDDLEDLSKYPDLLKILQRYEKNGTLDILTFWTDQFPNYIIDIGNILYLYHIFTLEEFVKNWKKNIASVDKSNIEDFYLKQQELADLYLGQRKIEKAQKIYEELIQSGYDSLGEISYSLAECYIYKHDYNPMIENYKRSALLGNIKAKERLLGFYIETNSNIDHKLLLRSLEELLRHEKKEFENENVSTLEAKNKLLKSYLRTLNVLGREIPDDVVEALNDINARALHIEFLDREQLLPIVRDNSLVLGQIYFDRKEYFDSIDNYMVAAKLEQGERIDSHLFEICDNVDKKFREVDVAYAKSNLGSLSSDIVYKLKDSDSNKGLTDEQKFEIVTKYFYVWKHISDVEFPDESFFDALVGLYAHNYKDKHDLLDKMMSFVKSEVTKLINKEESKK